MEMKEGIKMIKMYNKNCHLGLIEGAKECKK